MLPEMDQVGVLSKYITIYSFSQMPWSRLFVSIMSFLSKNKIENLSVILSIYTLTKEIYLFSYLKNIYREYAEFRAVIVESSTRKQKFQ